MKFSNAHLAALTTSSEHSDHVSRSSSFGSLPGTSNVPVKEPGKAELDERFRIVINRAVQFITSGDESSSPGELQLAKRLFGLLLQGLSSGGHQKKIRWGSDWSTMSVLRKNAAKMMVWLLGPQQNNATRIYAVRSLMDEPKIRDILLSLLEVHPQIEHKLTVFLCELLSRREEMPCADARACDEFQEAFNIWHLSKVNKLTEQEGAPGWEEELSVLRREVTRDRDIWIDNNVPTLQRIASR